MVPLWLTCVLHSLGLAFKTPLFCMPFALTLKHVTVKCRHVCLRFWMLRTAQFQSLLLFQNNTYEKNIKIKHFYTVGATTEFALNHCATVTWV